jgi:hypothetical protein
MPYTTAAAHQTNAANAYATAVASGATTVVFSGAWTMPSGYKDVSGATAAGTKVPSPITVTVNVSTAQTSTPPSPIEVDNVLAPSAITVSEDRHFDTIEKLTAYVRTQIPALTFSYTGGTVSLPVTWNAPGGDYNTSAAGNTAVVLTFTAVLSFPCTVGNQQYTDSVSPISLPTVTVTISAAQTTETP